MKLKNMATPNNSSKNLWKYFILNNLAGLGFTQPATFAINIVASTIAEKLSYFLIKQIRVYEM
jgi:hypothetical protein